MYAIQESHQLPDTMFTLSRVGDAAVVSLTCPAIKDRQAQILGRYLKELAPEVGGRIVLEVAGVGQFACAWINTLIDLTRVCERLGGRLFVQGMPRKDVRVLRATGIDRMIGLVGTRAEAMQQFGGGSCAPWKLAVARLLDIPTSPARRAA